LDPRRRKTGQIQMVGAYGAGTDETYRRTRQHRRADPGHRTYQQHIGIPQGGLVDQSPGQAGEATELAEELVEQRYVFTGNDVHGNPRDSVGFIVEGAGESVHLRRVAAQSPSRVKAAGSRPPAGRYWLSSASMKQAG